MNNLQQSLQDYVQLYRSFGLKFLEQEQALNKFLSFMATRGAGYITTSLALEWATQPTDVTPNWLAQRLGYVRGFARYLKTVEPRTEVPPTTLIPTSSTRARPYLYTLEEIRQLMAAAKAFPSNSGLKGLSLHCLFGLLVVTGLRVGEALALICDDVDLKKGILTIRETKFGKSRLVPLHASTQQMLSGYASKRDACLGESRSPFFLVAEHGGRLWGPDVRATFYKLSRQIGLRGATDRKGPRLHDFRHRFAIETLLRWYRSGEDIESRMPTLSTYLGHTNIKDTYWYLSACPELMSAAAQRLEKRWEEQL